MRQDAWASRESLLSAARELFARHGGGVSLRAIAEEAGVGIATLYRHFPTREALLLGVTLQIQAEAQAVADGCEAAWDANPEEAWREYVSGLAGLNLGALLTTLAEDDPEFMSSEEVSRIRAVTMSGVERVLSRARDAGMVRQDVTPLRFGAGIGMLTRPLPAVVETLIPSLHNWAIDVYVNGLHP